MTLPFRFAPPRPRAHEWLERPRLAEMLDGRFHRRVTVLRAGAGFGKTLLLAQALATNESDPLGIDAWLSCSPRDGRAGAFAEGLRTAVGAKPGPGQIVPSVCDAIWKQSPREVALVLDDVHHLGRDGPAVEILRGLLAELPENGHLVLASRTEPPVSLARLVAAGEGCVIEESELAFDAEERSDFLVLRGARTHRGELPGWPAVLELAAASTADVIDAYLWEEILSGLSPEHRRGLARLAGLDWIDDGRIEAFTGRPESVRNFLAGLPLASVEQNGAARLHGLWSSALSDIDLAWTEEEFARAVDHLTDTGHFQEAVELCLRDGREEVIEPVLSRFVARGWASAPAPALEALLATLPAAVRTSPYGKLVDGLHRVHTDPATAAPYLDAACEGLARRGDVDAEIWALTLRNHLAFIQVDADAARALAARAAEIRTPEGHAVELGCRTVCSIVESRPEEALAFGDELVRLPIDSRGQQASATVVALLDAGRPERAIAEIDAALPHAQPFAAASLLFSRFDARWLAGDIGAGDLAPLDAQNVASAGHAHNAAVLLSVLAYQNASLGRSAVARAQLDRATALVDRGLGARADMAFAVAKMAVLAGEGDMEGAAQTIERVLEALPAVSLVHRHSLRGAPLASILSPAARARCRSWNLGPCFALGMQAAEALLACREAGDVKPAAALPWDDYRRFRVALVPSLLLELAVAASAGGAASAGALAEELALDHRETLAALADSETQSVARAAADLLVRVPARPSGQLELRVLGELELVRDGRVVDDAALRRERVRALLHYLVARRSCRREEICAAFWPTLDTRAALNNLRVTLGHVYALLEPDRKPRAPSFFLPQHDDRLVLRTGDGLDIDADRFDSDLASAEAADAAGEPARVLELHERALSRYRGEYLADAADPSFGEQDRTRLRARFVGSALRAAALLLGHGEFDRALAWARRAVDADDLAEAAYRMQALVYLRKSDRASARAALESGWRALRAAGLTPDPETARLGSRLGIGL